MYVNSPYALYILGPRSGLAKKLGRLAAMFSLPSLLVYSGRGRASMRSVNLGRRGEKKRER